MVLGLALPSPRRARHVLGRNLVIYRRAWPLLATGVLEPLFYLLSIGLGLGHLVGRVDFAGHELAYKQFVAPALLAAAAMNGAILDTTYNLYYKLKIAKTYEGVLATPLSTADVALGEIGWAVARGAAYSATFLGVMAALGLVPSPWGLCCVPAAALVAYAFAATGMAATSYMRSWQDLDVVALALVPMFLFSATFYPLTAYVGWLAVVVQCTPLYQGVLLARSLDIGTVGWSLALNAAYLVVMGLAAMVITGRRLERLLAA
jgi:lipooligosaccharide transport system permease protein